MRTREKTSPPESPPGRAPPDGPPGAIRKHSVVISGHKTSISLETAFWEALRKIAATRGRSVNDLISEIDRSRAGNLSSAIRVYVLDAVQQDPPPRDPKARQR